MTNLNWFQARDLALLRSAIRRTGWGQWLIYRAHTWIISETGTDPAKADFGVEKRRVVQADDFSDSEFLAKDWTNEPADGMSLPPCALSPIATSPVTLKTSGAWSLTDFCGGFGTGGNVIPIGGPGITEDLPPDLELVIFPADGGDDPLVPDGGSGTCWTGAIPIDSVFVMVRLAAGIPAEDYGGNYCAYLSEAGANLAGDITFGSAISGVTRQVSGIQGFGPGDAAASFDATWDAIGWPNYAEPSTNLDPIVVSTGDTITARVDYLGPSSGKVYTVFAEYTFAPAC